MLRSIASDLWYGLRQLRQRPGFTVTAVLSLALGIGANTAIFQLVDAIRLKTLPVRDPQELASIRFAKSSSKSGNFSTRSAEFTSAQLEEIGHEQQAFSGLAAWSATRFNLAPGGEARYAEGLYVNGDFFRVLGVNALLGRTFTREDDSAACGNPGAVVSYAFWQREFGSDNDVLGRQVWLDGHTLPVIGVTPPAFFGVEIGHRYDVAIPMCADRAFSEDGEGRIPVRTDWWISMLGRLKPGWTLARADAHIRALSAGIMRASLPPSFRPDTAKDYLKDKLEVAAGGTGVSGLRSEYEQPLWLLMATTGLVLLIACANLANLLLARASVREREIAVRLAMGASRFRLVRQLLAESLLLAIFGAGLGVAIAQALSRGLLSFLSTPGNPVFVGLALDWRILGFTAALAILTCILFGLAPALGATRQSPASVMRAGGRGMTAGRQRFGLRRALVSTQVALSLVLLVGALLFVRSLQGLMNIDAGFQAEGVMSVDIDFSRAQYPVARRQGVFRELRDRFRSLPGVVSAAQVLMTPISGSSWNDFVGPDGSVAAGSHKLSFFNGVSPGYFRTMGTRLMAGRDFDDHDNLDAPKVAVVNQTFARKFLGGVNPVGHTFNLEAAAGKPETLYQIVGLVRDTKYRELREEFLPVAFVALAQNPDPFPVSSGTFVLRVAGSPGAVMSEVKAAAAEVNPAMSLEFHSLSRQLQDSLLRERLMATLSGAFALLAGLLATLGLYGVISYMVARRQNEIGVRMALGADRARVVRLVLREAVWLLVVGLVFGIAIALAAGRAASTLLFGLKPYDPLSMIAGVALLAIVALGASYFPALRAARLDPMTALRDE
ncbi:MAG: ABC transporter permease [Bryobacteraceae bacterium]